MIWFLDITTEILYDRTLTQFFNVRTQLFGAVFRQFTREFGPKLLINQIVEHGCLIIWMCPILKWFKIPTTWTQMPKPEPDLNLNWDKMDCLEFQIWTKIFVTVPDFFRVGQLRVIGSYGFLLALLIVIIPYNNK